MNEAVTGHEKVLFYKKNTRKYYLAKSIQSLFYAASRITLLPILITFWISPNIVSVAFLIY